MNKNTDIVFGISADTLKMVRSVLDGKSALEELQGAAAALDVDLKRAEKTNDNFGFSAARMAKQMDRLRQSYDPVYAASKRYETAVEKVERAHEKGVIQGDQYQAMLSGLGRKYLQVDAASDVMATSLTRVTRASQGSAGGLENAGYQIQDFAVQVGAGTSAMQAFGQQFPQLASSFGPVGIAIGTLGAVAIPLLSLAFKGLFDEAKSLDDAFGDVKQGLSDYEGYIKTASTATSELTDQFGQFAGQIKGFSEYMAGVALGQTFDDLRATIEPLKGGLSEVQNAFANLTMAKDAFAKIDMNENPDLYLASRDAVDLYAASLDEAAATLGILPDQAMALAAAMDALGQAKTMEDIARYSGEALAIIKQIAPAGEELPAPLRAAAIALEEMQRKAAEAAKATQDLAASAPKTGWMGIAIGETNLLIGRLIAAKAAQDALDQRSIEQQPGNLALAKYGSRGATSSQPVKTNGASAGKAAGPGMTTGSDRFAKNNLGFNLPGSELLPGTATSAGGGGGGGGSDPITAEIERLQQALMTEEQLEMESYAKRQAMLQQALEQRVVTQEDYAKLMESAQDKHQEAMSGIDVYRYGTGLQQAEAFMGGMADAMQGGNEQMQKISRAFGAAEALINAWRAFSQTMADPSLPFFAKFGAAASVLAAGMGAVSAIKSGSKTSGAATGGAARASMAASSGAASGGSAAAAAAPDQSQIVNISLTGDSIGRDGMSSLFDQINKGLAKGYRIERVNFT
jgi:hypothetical protein